MPKTSIHPSIRQSVSQSVRPSIHPSIYISIQLSIYLSIHLSIHLSINQSITQSINPFTPLSCHPTIGLSSKGLSRPLKHNVTHRNRVLPHSQCMRGRRGAQKDIHLSVDTEARVRSTHQSLLGLVVNKVAQEQFSPPVLRVCPVSIITHRSTLTPNSSATTSI